MHGLRTEGNETPEILFWTGLADLQEKAEKNNHFYSELYQVISPALFDYFIVADFG